MEDYEIAGLAIFRYIEPRFNVLTDAQLIQLYQSYSDQVAAASWLGVTNKCAEDFCKWAYKCPVDYFN